MLKRATVLSACVLLGLLSLHMTASAAEFVPRASKTGPTFYGPAKRAIVQRNVERYDWAKAEYEQVLAEADPFTKISDEELWKMIPSPVLPRAIGVNRDLGCPSCGNAIYGDRGSTAYAFQPALDHPWKMQCPNCKELFPKNDFAKFYASGISPEDGLFHYDRADRSLLFNVEHPDPNDPKHTWCVDDGRGWLDTARGPQALHLFIATYNYRIHWTRPMRGLSALCKAYAYSGKPIYAHKALVLMDRLADVFPMLNGIDGQLINFRPGSYWNGIVGPDYWASGFAGNALSYDMIYDGMDDIPEALAFIRRMSDEYDVPSDKSSVEAIRNHIEQRIFIDRMTTKQRSYWMNGTISQMMEAKIDMVLRGQEAIDDFATMHMPRIVPAHFLNNDGSGNERSTGYDGGAYSNYCQLFMDLAELDIEVVRRAINEYPKFGAVFEFWPDIYCVDAFIPHIGDTGTEINARHGFPCPPGPYMKLYELTGKPRYAQVAMRAVGGDVDKLPRNIFSPDPMAVHAKIAEEARKAGPWNPPSVLKPDYKLGILRHGKAADRTALWMFYSPQPGTSSHSHFDALNIGLYAFDNVVIPEQGYPLYTGGWPARWAWTSNTRSHATVVVDGQNQKHCGGGKLLGYAGKGSVQFIAAEARCVFDGVSRYERTLVSFEPEPGRPAFVDVFRVKGGKRHTYTMPLYYGAMEVTGVKLADAANKCDGYVTEVRQAAASSPWHADTAILDKWGGQVVGKIRATGAAFDGTIATGKGETRLGKDYAQKLPYLFLERQGDDLDSTFVVLYEPYRDTPIVPADGMSMDITEDRVRVELVLSPERRYTIDVKDGAADATIAQVSHVNGSIKETFDLPSRPRSLSRRHMDREITKRVSLPYWVHLPQGYTDDGACPVILFLHGAGERGTDLDKIKSYGPLAYAQQHEDFPFIVVAPQCPLMESWSVDALNTLLDEVLAEYAADADRVYLTGYSMGGAGTWELAIAHPERFAAIAPLCGRVVPLLAFRVWQTPTWVVHGEQDPVVPWSHSKEMVDVLRNMGNEQVEFTSLPDAGHDVWTQFYNDPKTYAWFLSHGGKD